jgi:hypothetical protein
MGGAYDEYGGEERCIQGFGEGNKPFGRPKCR